MNDTVLPNLDILLEYKNTHVLKRYSQDYPNNNLEAEETFADLLKFLWLSVKHGAERNTNPKNPKLNFSCGIHSEMKEIDDIWHTFLIFTKDYFDFCTFYFGKYIHHTPNTTDVRISKKDFKLDFTRFLSYVYDNLGEETTKKWFCSLLK